MSEWARCRTCGEESPRFEKKSEARAWGRDHLEDFPVGCELVELFDEAGGPVPIPLPSEPPRDRVIEMWAGGTRLVHTWRYSYGFWRIDGSKTGWEWESIPITAIKNRWTLRHVPAEGGES